jgi:hypothetical protein
VNQSEVPNFVDETPLIQCRAGYPTMIIVIGTASLLLSVSDLFSRQTYSECNNIILSFKWAVRIMRVVS